MLFFLIRDGAIMRRGWLRASVEEQHAPDGSEQRAILDSLQHLLIQSSVPR